MSLMEFLVATLRVAFGMPVGANVDTGGAYGFVLAWALILTVSYVVVSFAYGMVKR